MHPDDEQMSSLAAATDPQKSNSSNGVCLKNADGSVQDHRRQALEQALGTAQPLKVSKGQ